MADTFIKFRLAAIFSADFEIFPWLAIFPFILQ